RETRRRDVSAASPEGDAFRLIALLAGILPPEGAGRGRRVLAGVRVGGVVRVRRDGGLRVGGAVQVPERRFQRPRGCIQVASCGHGTPPTLRPILWPPHR